jgi:hypothetical protein
MQLDNFHAGLPLRIRFFPGPKNGSAIPLTIMVVNISGVIGGSMVSSPLNTRANHAAQVHLCLPVANFGDAPI